MNLGVAFAPLVGMPFLWAALAAACLLSLLLFVSRSRGATIRTLALALIVLALANPSLTREDRDPLNSVAVVVVDKSPSQNFGDRTQQTEAARAAVVERLSHIPGLEVRIGRGRPGRRRDRRHAAVHGARLGARRRADRPHRRRRHDHRRPSPRRAGRRRRARLCRAGSRAHHRTQGRTRPPRRADRRAALRHCRPAADRDLSGRGSGRERKDRRGHGAPRRRRRGNQDGSSRHAAERR